MSGLTFDDAIAAIQSGAHYSICGLTLTVNGVALAITDEQFDLAWDAMDEVDPDGGMLRLAESNWCKRP